MTVTDPRTWSDEIRTRYGVGTRPRWLLPAVVTGLVMMALVGFLGIRLFQGGISAGLASYSVEADDHVHLSFAVQRSEAMPATCVVRARAQDGFDVGYAVVSLPAAAGHSAHTYDLRTAYRAILGELLGCHLGQDAPANVPPAQFRPGVVPPEQPWSPAAA